ncbi:unnamed protein product, partial [Gongylonema pulchrum]|uniref:Col_cuticle_N domain-containing protein n=1 Tax=Gongylonema pulchrum TaxID=637853 RepID=A0A183D4X3_9BILA
MTDKEQLTQRDTNERQREAENLRRIAFCGVAVSTVATVLCVISVPIIYNYMQHVQSMMQNEVDFCRSRSGNIWREVMRTQFLAKSADESRTKRADVSSSGLVSRATRDVPECCGCGISPPGPPGPPGPDGKDGKD